MKAKLEIIGSMAAFGTIGAFVRHIPLPSGELALYRALIAAGAIFLWQLCSGQGKAYRPPGVLFYHVHTGTGAGDRRQQGREQQ